MPDEPRETIDPSSLDLQAADDTGTPGETPPAAPLNSDQDTVVAEDNPDAEMWGQMAEELDAVDPEDLAQPPEEAPTETPTETPETPTEPPKSEEPPKDETPAEPTTPETPPEDQPKAEDTPATPTEEQTAEPQDKQWTEEEVAEYWKQVDTAQQELTGELEKAFAISEEDASKLLTRPEEVLPRMFADTFVKMYMSLATGIMKNMPAALTQTMEANERQKALEDSFYIANAAVGREHKATVDKYKQVYMQMNPQAALEQVNRDVGIQVMFALGIDPSQAQTTQPAPATPAPATPQPSNVAPFKPAAPGASTPPRDAGSGNAFTDMADEMLREDVEG